MQKLGIIGHNIMNYMRTLQTDCLSHFLSYRSHKWLTKAKN